MTATNNAAGRFPTHRPRALVFAYACDPKKGSEAGAGWAMVQAVARFADLVVLVAPWYIDNIHIWQANHPKSRITFVPVPASRFSRLGQRHRLLWFLVYLRWARTAHRHAAELHAASEFDIVYHATPAVFWLPTPAVQLGPPVIWGPVGGGVTTPFRFWSLLGIRGIVDEIIDRVAVGTSSCLPATRRTWRSIHTCIAQNEQTLNQMPQRVRDRAVVLNHVSFANVPLSDTSTANGKTVIYLSPLETRKGPRLVIRALSEADPEVKLGIVGDGPERRPLETLAQKLGLAERVTFHGRVSRETVFNQLKSASAVVFTGLREEGGMALAEAMLTGCPVIVLANGGAETVARLSVDPERVVLVPPTNIRESARLIGEAMSHFAKHPASNRSPNLDKDTATRVLDGVFQPLLAPHVGPSKG